MKLSGHQLEALRNLLSKKAGAPVDWIAIAAARELTELGFALRTRNGWRITSAGEALLDLHRPAGNTQNNVVAVNFGSR